MGWPWSAWVIDRAREAAGELAGRMGIPTPPLAWLAFAAQISNETANGDPNTVGVRNANPFNITTGGGKYSYPGEIGHGAPGGNAEETHHDFALFGSPSAGARAAGYFYTAEADPAGYYAGVRQSFIGGDPVAIARAIESSPFATGHYAYSLHPAVERALGLAPGPVNIDAAIASPAAAPADYKIGRDEPVTVLANSAAAIAHAAGGFVPVITGGGASMFGGILSRAGGAVAGHYSNQIAIIGLVALALILIVAVA